MKAGLFSIAGIALLQLAAAKIPHKKHQHFHGKRDKAVVQEIVTDNMNVVYDSEQIIVYIDGNGNPVSTSTKWNGQSRTSTSFESSFSSSISTDTYTPPPPSPTPSPSPPAPPAANEKIKVNNFQAAPPSASHSSSSAPPPPPPPPSPSPSKQAPVPSPSASPSSSSNGNGGGSSNSGPSSPGPGFSNGIAYSPYNADNSCKSTSQVAQDLSIVQGYNLVRLYGVDCNQIANVLAAIKGKNIQLFLGIFDINSIPDAVSTMKSALNGDWSIVNTVSVGNELVNTGAASVGQVTGAIGTARSQLKSAGYSGPVVTVDTMTAMKNNPGLCQASDFCAINCHAFFDGNVLPSGAGAFVQKWAKDVSDAAGGKTVVVTESGWPTQGGNNNQAVAGQSEHQDAISSLKSSFSSNLIYYGAFNDLWKKDSGSTYGCEKYWGIYGNAPSNS